MADKILDVSVLSHEDREIAERWFLDHTCDSWEAADMIIIEDKSSGIGTALIASCSCGAELDLTDYVNW